MDPQIKSVPIDFDTATLYDQGFFSSIDFYFAGTMKQIAGSDDPIVTASCALVSKWLAVGHVCVDIDSCAGAGQQVSETGDGYFVYPEKADWLDALESSPLVSALPDAPLVLDASGRLYLARFYDYQTRLVTNIVTRLSQATPADRSAVIDPLLDQVFSSDLPAVESQKKAVKHGLINPFTIISGGPGTGKTYITDAIRELGITLSVKNNMPEPVVLCMAPTGKAASRMAHGRTIHSVLRPFMDKPGFRYNRDNPLQADIAIIDEASMIDMALLTQLLEAIPLNCRVILIGDSHQLASVQAGSVFSDICDVPQLTPCIHHLTYNFRSQGRSGIEALALAINTNRPDRVGAILEDETVADVVFQPVRAGESIEDLVRPFVIREYDRLGMGSESEALTLLDSFKILSALHSGEYGTLQINHICEKILRSKGNFAIPNRPLRKVIMVTANDYQRGLFNGDTGLAEVLDGELTAIFPSVEGNAKRFRAADLPAHETAFCITVHKAQGSEFNTVLLIIPDHLSPVLTRRLLYTGVTRAKNKVIIAGDMQVLKAALGRNTRRHSGIAGQLALALDRPVASINR
jgi:exodeoxyribonuclease V alpha subunit